MGLFNWREKSKRQPAPQKQLPPPGWHDAYDRPGFMRYWDGDQWTDQYREVRPRAIADITTAPPQPTAGRKSPPSIEDHAASLQPVQPWAKATVWQRAVGESNYAGALRDLVRGHRAKAGEYGIELDDIAATVVADRSNRYDDNAVAVLVQGRLVGYLPRDIAVAYSAPLQDLTERGQRLAVQARVWVPPSDGGDDRGGSVTVILPPADGVQSFNEFPEDPYQVLPHGGAVQVTGEEEHMDVLGKYVADRERYLAVTLHVVTEQKTERSQPYNCVEVRLGGQRVGVLTKATSEKIADVASYVAERGKLPVCRAVLKGSPLRAELTLHVAKSHEVTRRWLDGLDDA